MLIIENSLKLKLYIMGFIKDFLLLFRGRSINGSGRRNVNINRRNARTLTIESAEEHYEVYKRYPMIRTIVNRISNSAGNVPIWVSKNDTKYESEETARFLSLMRNPSRYNQGRNFLARLVKDYLIYGCVIVARKRYRTGDTEYYVVHPTKIESYKLKEKRISPFEPCLESVRVKYPLGLEKSESVEISANDLCIIGDELEFGSGHLCFGGALSAVKDELEVYANLVDVLDESYGNGGARKIISFKNTSDELAFNTPLQNNADEVKKELRENYGGNSGDEHYIISQNDVNVSNLSSPVGELDGYNMLSKLECTICNAFDFPVSLLGLKTGAYKSQTEAEKSLYVGCISPIANLILSRLNVFFGTNIDARIELDYSELDFFQDGKQKKGAAIQTFMQGATQAVEMGALTKEEVRNELKNIL